jgi:hypothetical protein
MATVHGLLRDTAFRDLSGTAYPGVGEGTPLLPSTKAISYLQTPKIIIDPRADRDWLGAHDATTLMELYVDGVEYADFVTHVDGVYDNDSTEIEELFNIIDRVTVLIGAAENVEDVETALIGSADFGIYVAESFTMSEEARVNGTAYNAADTVVALPRWVSFDVSMDDGGGAETTTLKLWVDNATILTDYPINSVTEVVPLLGYNNLLTGSLEGGGYNQFDVSETAAELVRDHLNSNLPDQSGLYLQSVKLVGSEDTLRPMSFGIIHKGVVPDILTIRTAIREDLLASGTGNEAAWKARIPELFIVDQFYIVPMWDAIYEQPGGDINQSAVSVSVLRARVKTALPHLTEGHIDTYMEVASVSYAGMQVGIVPHPDNVNYDSFTALHPSYRNYAPSEPGFATMTADTRDFATTLNDVMPIAQGTVESEVYLPRTDLGASYIPFVKDVTEYYVMDSTSYLDRVGE